MSPIQRRRAASVLLVAVLLGGLALVGPAQREATQHPIAPPHVVYANAEGQATAPVRNVAREAPATSPRRIEALLERVSRSSLRGSEPDGTLAFDALGRLQADAGLRRLFDHALSLMGEFSLDEIRTLVAHWVERTHGATAAEEAIALFDRYLALKRAEQSLAQIDDPAERLAQLHALRRLHFGDDAHALFGEEEAYLSHTLERLALLRDPTLDAASRERALMELEAQRAPDQRRAERVSQSPSMLAEHESQLDALQADATQRYSERRALWGEDAAQRLAALDAAESDWAHRLDLFRRDRTALLGDPGLGETEREQAVSRLLAARFSEPEQRRVRALLGLPAPYGG